MTRRAKKVFDASVRALPQLRCKVAVGVFRREIKDMSARMIRCVVRQIIAGISVVGLIAAIDGLSGGNLGIVSGAFAQEGQGHGGPGSGKGQGGPAGGQGVTGGKAGQGGMEEKVLRGKQGTGTPGGEEDSDRPDWAGTKGGKAGGGGKPEGAGTKKGDIYGDLWVILRDTNGVPILYQYGHVQPLDAEGNLIPLNEDGEPLDPTKVVEVEFSRLSVVRSPSKVTDKAYDEVIDKLNSATSITVDSAGRLVVTIDGETSTIDSPLENLALYETLLSKGYLPGLTASDEVLGSLTYLKDATFTSGDYTTAASLLGAASDKEGSISQDMVAYLNIITGVTGTITGPDGKTYVDYTTYSYDRTATYPGTVEIMVPNDDGTYSIKEVSLMEAVFSNEPYSSTGITAFSQAADDARAVIEFLHDNPLPATTN